MSREQKKAIFILLICLLLFWLVTGYGLARDDGKMGTAMKRARALVADTRKEIQKEMDKPFILRLFGSLFGMENNSFQRMQEELPKIFADAMPDVLSDNGASPDTSALACEGMRLLDGLQYLHERGYAPTDMQWIFDDTVNDDQYLALPGQILQVEALSATQARLVIQMRHNYTGEEGLGDSPRDRQAALAGLRTVVDEEAAEQRYLGDWLNQLEEKDRRQAIQAGVPLLEWSPLTVTTNHQAALPTIGVP